MLSYLFQYMLQYIFFCIILDDALCLFPLETLYFLLERSRVPWSMQIGDHEKRLESGHVPAVLVLKIGASYYQSDTLHGNFIRRSRKSSVVSL